MAGKPQLKPPNPPPGPPTRAFWWLFLGLHLLWYAPELVFTQLTCQASGLSFFQGLKVAPPVLFGELALLFLLPRQRVFQGLASGVVVLLFFYQGYAAFYQATYGEPPHFQDDYALAREVLPVFLSSIGGHRLLYFGLGLAAALLLGGTAWALCRAAWKAARPHHRRTLLVLVGLALLQLFVEPNFPFRWVSEDLAQSLHLPAAHRYASEANPCPQTAMPAPAPSPPDVFVLFLESYGAVAWQHPAVRPALETLADSALPVLGREGWQVFSTFSQAPIIGGRSWLSFTTGLTGLPVKSQVQYNDLLRRHADCRHLVRYLHALGYETWRLATMRTNPTTRKLIPYPTLERFWGFDHFLEFEDIPYAGPPFDFYGGIPDQYALGFLRDQHLLQRPGPHFVFFITLSSHIPWYEPPPLPPDWRTLDSLPAAERSLKGFRLERYRKAMVYELRMALQFALQYPRKAVFLLIGDHQPALLLTPDRPRFRFATPLHVLTRDSFHEPPLREQGLVPGLEPRTDSLRFHHEDLYPLIQGLLAAEH